MAKNYVKYTLYDDLPFKETELGKLLIKTSRYYLLKNSEDEETLMVICTNNNNLYYSYSRW